MATDGNVDATPIRKRPPPPLALQRDRRSDPIAREASDTNGIAIDTIRDEQSPYPSVPDLVPSSRNSSRPASVSKVDRTPPKSASTARSEPVPRTPELFSCLPPDHKRSPTFGTYFKYAEVEERRSRQTASDGIFASLVECGQLKYKPLENPVTDSLSTWARTTFEWIDHGKSRMERSYLPIIEITSDQSVHNLVCGDGESTWDGSTLQQAFKDKHDRSRALRSSSSPMSTRESSHQSSHGGTSARSDASSYRVGLLKPDLAVFGENRAKITPTPPPPSGLQKESLDAPSPSSSSHAKRDTLPKDTCRGDSPSKRAKKNSAAGSSSAQSKLLSVAVMTLTAEAKTVVEMIRKGIAQAIGYIDIAHETFGTYLGYWQFRGTFSRMAIVKWDPASSSTLYIEASNAFRQTVSQGQPSCPAVVPITITSLLQQPVSTLTDFCPHNILTGDPPEDVDTRVHDVLFDLVVTSLKTLLRTSTSCSRLEQPSSWKEEAFQAKLNALTATLSQEDRESIVKATRDWKEPSSISPNSDGRPPPPPPAQSPLDSIDADLESASSRQSMSQIPTADHGDTGEDSSGGPPPDLDSGDSRPPERPRTPGPGAGGEPRQGSEGAPFGDAPSSAENQETTCGDGSDGDESLHSLLDIDDIESALISALEVIDSPKTSTVKHRPPGSIGRVILVDPIILDALLQLADADLHKPSGGVTEPVPLDLSPPSSNASPSSLLRSARPSHAPDSTLADSKIDSLGV